MANLSAYERRLRALGVGVHNVADSSPVVGNNKSSTHNAKGLLVVGGSTALNRFGGSCSTPSTQHTSSAMRVRSLRQHSRKSGGDGGEAQKEPAVEVAAGFPILDLPPDACCLIFELLTPSDLGQFGSVASNLQLLPRDNWLWFNLTSRRFPSSTSGCNVTSRLNWEDEYQYLLLMESRSRSFMVAQMQGRLGRLPPLPKRRNRKPINYFQPRGDGRATISGGKETQIPVESVASGNSVLEEQALGDRQGCGASVWSALREPLPNQAGEGQSEL